MCERQLTLSAGFMKARHDQSHDEPYVEIAPTSKQLLSRDLSFSSVRPSVSAEKLIKNSILAH